MLAVVTALLIAAGVYFSFKGERIERIENVPQVLNFNSGRQAQGTRYEDPSGFSFELPQGYRARKVEEEAQATIIIEKGAGSGFQIVVSSYDEPSGEFGVARIKQDLPDLVMRDVKEISVANGKGVAFDSDSGHEIWFVAGGSLFQMTAPQNEIINAKNAIDTFAINSH